MKKLTLILFVAFYSLAASGFSINLHYCLGELEEIEFFAHDNNCCCGDEESMSGCCDDEESMSGCCDDETFQLSSGEQQLLPVFSYDLTSTYLIEKPSFEVFVSSWMEREESTFVFTDLPPPNDRPIWLINCNLTYYG